MWGESVPHDVCRSPGGERAGGNQPGTRAARVSAFSRANPFPDGEFGGSSRISAERLARGLDRARPRADRELSDPGGVHS